MNAIEYQSKMRFWQIDGNRMHEDHLKEDWLNMHIVYSVAAGVGTGKTFETFNKIYRCIKDVEMRDEKSTTFSMFIAPTIWLCEQHYDTAKEFFHNIGLDIEIKVWNCESDTISSEDKRNVNINGKHVLWIICDQSLWGSSKKEMISRYAKMSKAFEESATNGRKFIFCGFDEAHNYSSHQDKMFGKRFNKNGTFLIDLPKVHKKDIKTLKPLIEIFNIVQVASGTPHDYMKGITKVPEWKQYFVECPFYAAIKNGLIMKPILNVIVGSSKNQWPSAILVTKKWIEDFIKKNKYQDIPRGIYNVNGIDSIHSIETTITGNIQDYNDKNNVAIIHGTKATDNDIGQEVVLKAKINRKEYDDPNKVKKMLSGIDSNEWLDGNEKKKVFEDSSKPLGIFQVDMLSEGIDIKSLNYCITETNAGVRGMQQIGRVVRTKDGKKFSVVFVFVENMADVSKLFNNLGEFGLTADCFEWGSVCDLNKGSSPETSGNAIEQKATWDPISLIDVQTIETKIDGKFRNSVSEKLFECLNDEKNKKMIEAILTAFKTMSFDSKKKLQRMFGCESTHSKVARKNSKKNDTISDCESTADSSEVEHSENTNDCYTIVDLFNSLITQLRSHHKKDKVFEKIWKTSNDNKAVIANAMLHNEIGKLLIDNSSVEMIELIENGSFN